MRMGGDPGRSPRPILNQRLAGQSSKRPPHLPTKAYGAGFQPYRVMPSPAAWASQNSFTKVGPVAA